ncbi:MAG: hypothetical protein ACR2J6_07675 [Thermoleophilaceae bacterium]
MPSIEPLTLGYALHELPPDRLPFTRWRWELWHGSRLEATGWQLSERGAARSVRRTARGWATACWGVPPRETKSSDFEPFRPGTSVRIRDGAVIFVLVPLHLEEAVGAAA